MNFLFCRWKRDEATSQRPSPARFSGDIDGVPSVKIPVIPDVVQVDRSLQLQPAGLHRDSL